MSSRGGDGWEIDPRTLRPRITDLGVFRAALAEDALREPIEAMWSGRPMEAVALLDAREQTPRVRALRADALRDLHRHDEALGIYRELVVDAEGTPREAVMRQHYGKALFAAGIFEDAAAEFARALELRRAAGAPEDQIDSSRQALARAEEELGPAPGARM